MAARAEPVVRPLAERFPAIPAKTEDAVRLNGAVQMVAGSMLALGRWPRLSALALAATQNTALSPEIRQFVGVLASSFILFTLFIGAPTLRPLMRFLKLDRLSPADVALRDR